MNSLKKINVFCGSQIVKNSVRSMSKEIFPPSQEPEIPAYQERVGEPLELRKASDSNLSWNVDLEQQSPVYENVEEEPVLTSLVREQYMKRLLQCLHENSTRYDKSKDVGDGDAKSHRLERRAHALEKKALRSCMVAKLYIRSMLTIIEDIKKTSKGDTSDQTESDRTNHSQDYSSRENFQSPNASQKRSQINRPVSSSQNTPQDRNMISTNTHSAELPKQRTPMKIPTIDEIRAYEESQRTQDCINVVPFLSAQDLNDVSSILDSLPLNLGQPGLSSYTNPDVLESHTAPPVLSLDQRLEQMKHVLPTAPSEAQSLEISSTNTAQDSLISPRKRKCDGARHKTKKLLKVSKVAELAQRRISEVVLEDEQTLFQERVALVFKLEQELQVLPLAQRSSLENLYTKLFGPGHNYFLDLSEEKQSDITRKRIASLVVAELEPYYAGEPKRIGNKNLFKYLAKYITELIYTMNLCPDAAEVHERVAEFFVDGRSINCESDIYVN